MPSLILTGHACTGKTTFATLLSKRAKAHTSGLIQEVVIINEKSARPDKTLFECYSTSKEEKLTRSALKSEFDKYVVGDKKTLVILDSMNYIKGFRYELHLVSKAVGEKHAVIWLLCGEDVAKKWNDRRRMKGGKIDGEIHEGDDKGYFYTEEMMDELMQRYEPPDQRNRWDRPLYRVDVHSTLSDSVLKDLNISRGDGSSSNNNNDNSNNDNNDNDNGDDDETSRTAEKILNKSVYNMHSLSDAIKDPTQSKTLTSNKKMGSSFRRATATTTTTGSGFRRAYIPTTTTTAKKECSERNRAANKFKSLW